MTEKSHVSMAFTVCGICGNKNESKELLLDRRMKKSLDKETFTGYEMCPECKGRYEDSYIALVECSNKNRPHHTMKFEEATRTGRIFHLKEHAFIDMFDMDTRIGDPPEMIALMFIEEEVGDKLQKLSETND